MVNCYIALLLNCLISNNGAILNYISDFNHNLDGVILICGFFVFGITSGERVSFVIIV